MKSLKTIWNAYCLICGISIFAWFTYNWWDDPLRNSLIENGYKKAAMSLPEFEEKDLVKRLKNENIHKQNDNSISSDLCGERKCFSSIQNGLTCALIQDIVFFEAKEGQVYINLRGTVPNSIIKNTLTEVSAEMMVTNEHLFFKTRSYLVNLLQVATVQSKNLDVGGGINYKTYILFRDGTELLLNKKYTKGFKEKIEELAQH